MEIILAILTAGVVGFFVGRITDHRLDPKSEQVLQTMRSEAHKALSLRSKHRSDQMYDFIVSHVTQQHLRSACFPKQKSTYGAQRKDLVRFFALSDSTVRRYLRNLEKEGKIIQTRSSGRSVRYVPNVPLESLK